MDYIKLVADLKAAQAAARSAVAANPDDGGTCNFDSATIIPPKALKASMDAALRDADLHAWKGSGRMWKGSWILSPGAGGQGASRTRAAEAMCKSLKEAGWDASMYYQMD